jgi:predicted dehydrogenase
MDKVRIGIIGTGSISNMHANGYKRLPNVEMVAACDIVEPRVKAFAEKYGIPKTYTKYEDLLANPDVDAVSICTWNNGHAPIAIAALKAGKHVLTEKPPAMNTAEALAMAEAEKASGKLLMVGFVRRFGVNTRIFKDFIDKGYMGDIYYAKTGCVRRVGNPLGWFADKKRSGGGPLIDLGVHMIDLVRYLMGKPLAVSVTGATFSKIGPRTNVKGINRYVAADAAGQCDVEDMATAMVRFDNGAVMFVETSFSQHVKQETISLEMFGTKAGAKMEPKLEFQSEMNDYLVDMNPVYNESGDTFSANFNAEMAHFVDCVQNGTKCMNPIGDGVELMRILDAIYESAATGREVVIKR